MCSKLRELEQDRNISREERRIKRLKTLSQINGYKVPIPVYWLNKKIGITPLDTRYSIFLGSNLDYNRDTGIKLLGDEVL